MSDTLTPEERAHRAAERLRNSVAEHANGPDCGDPACLLHRWERNRAATEERYREHLRLGPERCGCGMCQRNRKASS